MLPSPWRGRVLLLFALCAASAQAGCSKSQTSCGCASSESCVAGKCQSASLSCALPSPAQSSAKDPVQVIALGTKRVGETVQFGVPAGAVSITLVEQVISAAASATFSDAGMVSNTAAPMRVIDPTGKVVFDQFDNPSVPAQALLYFGSLSPGVGTVTLPNTTAGLELAAAGLPQGTWKAVVSDLAHVCTRASNCAAGGGSASGVYDVTALVKTGGDSFGLPATNRVDVTFNLMPPLSAASAATDKSLLRLVGSLTRLLSGAGLTLQNVVFTDVPAKVAEPLAPGVHIDDSTACGELAQLFATAPPGRQINVFLVGSFITSDSAAGTMIVGVDGTIPGPATFSPSLQGGVAVSTADLEHNAGKSYCQGSTEPQLTCGSGAVGDRCCGADITAYIVAHEIGHYLGLYHTTEAEGTQFDPLDDTPQCPCQSCASSRRQCADSSSPPSTPHQMGVAECTASAQCGGGDNLMFWLLDDGAAGKVTSEQQKVMRANAVVY